MATSEQFLTYVLEQLSDVEGVRTRPMMGEYLLYLRDRLAGGICDNRLMIKPVSAARALLARLFQEIYDELPPPKPKKRRKPA